MAMILTDSLGEARRQLNEAIKEVQEAAVDHDEAEREPDGGTWMKSQTYAVLLLALQHYETASTIYKQMLAERITRHGA